MCLYACNIGRKSDSIAVTWANKIGILCTGLRPSTGAMNENYIMGIEIQVYPPGILLVLSDLYKYLGLISCFRGILFIAILLTSTISGKSELITGRMSNPFFYNPSLNANPPILQNANTINLKLKSDILSCKCTVIGSYRCNVCLTGNLSVDRRRDIDRYGTSRRSRYTLLLTSPACFLPRSVDLSTFGCAAVLKPTSI